MKNSVLSSSRGLVISTVSMLMFTIATTNIVEGQIENDVSTDNILNIIEDHFPFKIGEVVFETQGHSEGIKIIDMDKQKIEGSWSGNGTLQNGIQVIDFGTYFATIKDDGYWHGNGHGMIMSFDNEVVKYTFQSIGKMEDGKFKDIGSVIFDATTIHNGTLSSLENTIGIYTGEIDINGNSIIKVWELEK